MVQFACSLKAWVRLEKSDFRLQPSGITESQWQITKTIIIRKLLKITLQGWKKRILHNIIKSWNIWNTILTQKYPLYCCVLFCCIHTWYFTYAERLSFPEIDDWVDIMHCLVYWLESFPSKYHYRVKSPGAVPTNFLN